MKRTRSCPGAGVRFIKKAPPSQRTIWIAANPATSPMAEWSTGSWGPEVTQPYAGRQQLCGAAATHRVIEALGR